MNYIAFNTNTEGGLGNHLYYIAIVIEYCKKFNREPLIINNNVNNIGSHNISLIELYFNLFNNKLKLINYHSIDTSKFIHITEKRGDKFEEIINIENKNIFIDGFRQSYKYYSDYTRQYMTNLIYSNETYYNEMLDYYNSIKNKYNDMNDDNYYLIHIRRGDFYTKHYYINYEFYNRVLNNMGNDGNEGNIKIILFSDDIQWCINNFKLNSINNNKIHFVDINNMYKELILMSFIKNVLLSYYNDGIKNKPCYFSTYSWWGTYIGPKKKNVYYDGSYMNYDTYNSKYDEFYLPEWTKII